MYGGKISFLDKIKGKQFTDEKLIRILDKVLRGEAKEAKIDEEGVLRIKGRVCIPRVNDLIHTILIEAHSSMYSIHPGNQDVSLPKATFLVE